MTLLITVFAAVIATVVWYNRKDDNMKLGILLFMLILKTIVKFWVIFIVCITHREIAVLKLFI